MKILNNFILGKYISPEYFCDRESETKRLLSAIRNGRNTILISHRRMGKTGLIFHVKYFLDKENDIKILYLDLLDTQNMRDFIKEFAQVSIEHLQTRSSRFFKNFGKMVSGIRPTLSVNPFSGLPEINIDVRDDVSREQNLADLFRFLNSQSKHIVIAIDEFQQILNYPEPNVEALLRKYIQQSNNLTFIYSGSQKHLLSAMFSDYKRPFYQSAEFLFLDKIPEDAYQKFIIDKFSKGKQKIEIQEVKLILELSKRHTYYVQYLCNRLFSLRRRKIDAALIFKTLDDIIFENRSVYDTYRRMLSTGQFDLLKAIAKENHLTQPTSKAFIQKYKLSTPSSVKRAMQSLLSKELIYEDDGVYKVYDVFFSRYLERL